MKAVQIESYGGPEVMQLVDIPKPEPRSREVLLKVDAAGLNYSDILIREGRYVQNVKLPYIMGRECAATIEAVGKEVDKWQVGQKVIAALAGGAMAEYVTAYADGLIPYPEILPPEEAAGIFVQGLTAIHCLEDCGRLEAGETVLIHAAAGGVGTLAVQIAKTMGAKVIGTASSDEKCTAIRELGAEAVNYSNETWAEEVKALNGGKGVDLILESVGGDIFERSFREVLAEVGRLVVFGVAGGRAKYVNNTELLASSKSIIGYFLPLFLRHKPQAVTEASVKISKLMQEGRLRVMIGGKFPLEEAVAAFNHMQNRASIGKIVIVP